MYAKKIYIIRHIGQYLNSFTEVCIEMVLLSEQLYLEHRESFIINLRISFCILWMSTWKNIDCLVVFKNIIFCVPSQKQRSWKEKMERTESGTFFNTFGSLSLPSMALLVAGISCTLPSTIFNDSWLSLYFRESFSLKRLKIAAAKAGNLLAFFCCCCCSCGLSCSLTVSSSSADTPTPPMVVVAVAVDVAFISALSVSLLLVGCEMVRRFWMGSWFCFGMKVFVSVYFYYTYYCVKIVAAVRISSR